MLTGFYIRKKYGFHIIFEIIFLLLKKYNAEEETKMNEKESPHQPDNLSNDDMRV